MLDIKSFCKVVLFLQHPEILDFCRKALILFPNVTEVDSYDFSSYNKGDLLLIDSSVLQDSVIISGLTDFPHKEACVCIIHYDSDKAIRKFCEKNFGSIVYFPGPQNHLQDVCGTHIEKMRKQFSKLEFNDGFENGSVAGYFLGTSRLITEVRQEIRRASKTSCGVLLLGETGTGKSTAAKVIHKISDRGTRQLYSVNVPVIVDTLASSELFGTERGAYTDAVTQQGIFKQADKSTLVLEEIGLASEKIQTVLLQILENGNVKSVGSDKEEKIDVRMIYTTNSDLEEMLQRGLFRHDLYYRIADIIIRMPSLRERREDISAIVMDFLKSRSLKITENAMKKLEMYNWPGNIRELNQCLLRAARECLDETIQDKNVNFGLFGE